ncbi:2-oxo-4-hydroxy-4-carboxy-5-ureidoimidazoline decarboxylase [Sneathiella limimaris]|uniref:2-oxo-4-hydroxy-4-carboxy-5-ureidoimidazoline decarboxylase n=1 Tax=Sneathiella limimaris TaxID=1964213 RepID=UPI00146A3204|nr:2-oxo-4-hydroxy-4-carboxy-5-ureidoimidazoline decarboxylase [Sneathiella limimaris]
MANLKHRPSQMTREQFIDVFGGVYEHSPWVAEGAWDHGLTEDHDDAEALADLMSSIVAAADTDRKMTLIKAHPDLAGKAAVRGELTAESTSEQARAGLSECTEEEFARFQEYNAAYKQKFGFPFIKAVRNSNRFEILKGFEERLKNDVNTEFSTALKEIDKIAAFRLQDL